MSIIALSTRDRVSGSSHNGKIKLNYQLDGSYKVKEIVLHNSIYSVNPSNNKVYFAESAVDATATLSDGTYNAQQLAIELKAQMDTAGSLTYTVGYSPTTNKLTIAATGNYGFKFASFTTSSARYLLGKNAIDDVEAASQVSDNTIDLSPYRTIFFSFPEGGEGLKTTSNNDSSIYLSANGLFADIVRKTYDEDAPLLAYNKKTTISYRVHDKNGNDIDLQGGDWEVLLLKN